MSFFADTVESGYCKGGVIRLKGFSCKPVLIKRGLIFTTKRPINRRTVADYQVLETQMVVGTSSYRSQITFNDGNVCTVYLSNVVHNAILEALG